MKVVFSHLTGSPFSRNAALAIHEQKALHEVVTAFGFKNDAAIERILSRFPTRWRPSLKRELGRRNWGLPEEVRFSRHGAREGFRAVLSALKLHRYIHVPHDKMINANAVALDRAVARHHLGGADAVYCFEDTAAETFAAARARGLTCLYDLPIMHYKMSRAIMAEEIERFPAFRWPACCRPTAWAWPTRT
jgi:starch synthase